MTSDGKNLIPVQPVSHGLDSNDENFDPNETFRGTQSNLYDKQDCVLTVR